MKYEGNIFTQYPWEIKTLELMPAMGRLVSLTRLTTCGGAILKILAECNSVFSVRDLFVVTGKVEGIFARGRFIEIDKNLCRDLEQGEFRNLVVSYTILGPYGCELPRTEVFTLSLCRREPTISSLFKRQTHITGDRVQPPFYVPV